MRTERRTFLKQAAAAGSLLGLPRILRAEDARAPGGKPQSPTNIILFMTDDQGWFHVGYNGHPVLKTPNIDALCANGLRLDRFYAASPVCGPTRAGIMTGTHMYRLQGRGAGKGHGARLNPKERGMAQVLKEAGYATAHYGKYHLGPRHRDFGFDEWCFSGNYYEAGATLTNHKGEKVTIEGDGSVAVTKMAIEFIGRQVKSNKPFFTVIWTGSPHSPHRPVEQDVEPYLGKGGARYYGEIAGADRAVGILRKGLRDLKVADDTLIWFCSDNGPDNPGGSPLRGHKRDVLEGGLRVPGCIEWPAAIKPGSHSAMPVSALDMLPTLAPLAGVRDIKSNGPIDGIDVGDLLRGTMKERSRPIPFQWHETYGLIDNRYKIIVGDPSPMGGGGGRKGRKKGGGRKGRKKGGGDKVVRSPKSGEVYLYDIVKDPGEKKNLAKTEPRILADLLARAKKWYKEAMPG